MPRIETSFYVIGVRSNDDHLPVEACRSVMVRGESADGFEIGFVVDRGDSPVPGDEMRVSMEWGEGE